MEEPFKSFYREQLGERSARRLVRACGILAMLTLPALVVLDCTSTTPPLVAKAETDLCKARADWLLAVAVDPALAPAPGSARARLEAAEDAFCASAKASTP